MKKMFLVLSVLIVSLACLQGALMADVPVSATPPVVTQTAAAVKEREKVPAPQPSTTAQACAVVIASKALHVRDEPSEHGKVLTWLIRGDVVRVLDRTNADWWLIEQGYVRAKYLEVGKCSP